MKDGERFVEGQREITIQLLLAGGLLGLEAPADMIWSWPMERGEEQDFCVRASWRPEISVLGVWKIPRPTAARLSHPLPATTDPPDNILSCRWSTD